MRWSGPVSKRSRRSQSQGVSRITNATIKNVASHCHALSRTSLTPKGTLGRAEIPPAARAVSPPCAAAGAWANGFAVGVPASISELEIDKRAAARRTDAEVHEHPDGDAHTHKVGLEQFSDL